MKNKIVFVVILLSASIAFALDPMGPATTELKKSKGSLGFDFSFSEMDIEVSGNGYEFTAKDVKQAKFYGNIGFAIVDNWEAFLRLGAVKAQLGDFEFGGVSGDFGDFESDYSPSFGFGSRLNIFQKGNFSWGILGQASWTKIKGFNDATVEGYLIEPEDTEAELWEVQVATGPTIRLNDRVKIYGGPFYHMIDGDFDFDGNIDGVPIKGSLDLEEDSQFGVYGGIQVDWSKKYSRWNLEVMGTGSGIGFGTQIVMFF